MHMYGEQIRKYRAKAGWTQEVLAEKLDISVNSVSAIERGVKHPSFSRFIKIANLLHVSTDVLLQDELDDGFVATTNEPSGRLEALPVRERERILEITNFLIDQAERTSAPTPGRLRR